MKLLYKIILFPYQLICSLLGCNIIGARVTLATVLIGLKRGYSWNNILLLLKQSALETGYWQSNFMVNHSNPFGMHYPNVRPTTAQGSVQGDGGYVATYSDDYDGVLDRFLWDEYNSINGKSKTYLDDIQNKSYNPDPDYPNKVLSIPDNNYALSTVILVVVIVAFIYLLFKTLKNIL